MERYKEPLQKLVSWAVFFLIGLILIFFYSAYSNIGSYRYPIIRRSKKEEYFYDHEVKDYVKFPMIHNETQSLNLSVIVPAYNEEKRLHPMLGELFEFLEERRNAKKDFKYEVIVVSDGSNDKTVEVAQEYSKKYGSDLIRVLDLQPNRGKGGAVRLGVLSSRGAVILFADADGATKFSDLVKLEESLHNIIGVDYLVKPQLVAKERALICGSRAHLEVESMARRSVFRNLLMHGFHLLVWSFAVKSIRDTQCGFKLFTRHAAELLFINIHVERWAFDVELLYLAEYFKIPLAEVAVNWTEIEGSKIVPVLSWIQMGKDVIKIWYLYRFGLWKTLLMPINSKNK